MKNKWKVKIVISAITLIEGIAVAFISVKWGQNNIPIVNITGENIILKGNDIQEISDENEELKNEVSDYESKISDYESQINDLKSQSESLSEKLGVANGELDDAPVIEYRNFGLSIDGEEKTVNKDKSSVVINGREYYSKDFLDNLLPSDKETIEKDNMLYVGKVVKEKSNLFDRQMIDISESAYVKVETNVKDTYGNIHDKAVVFLCDDNSITFNANKEYSKLKCVLAVLDGESGGGIMQIESEQGVLYTSEEILSTTEPIEVDIPINYASSITIKQIHEGWSYNIVTDAVLYNEE